MLNGPEERRLAEIELTLAADDPDFVRRFRDGKPATGRRRRWPYTLAGVVSILLFCLAALLGIPALALFAAVSAVAAFVQGRRVGRTGGRRPGR